MKFGELTKEAYFKKVNSIARDVHLLNDIFIYNEDVPMDEYVKWVGELAGCITKLDNLQQSVTRKFFKRVKVE